MHQIIRIIVYAEDKKEARDKAEITLKVLTGEGKSFDYGTFFDDEESSMSGQSRWGKLQPVSLASSKEGKNLIKQGMDYTKDSFMENLKDIRKLMSYQDEEIFQEKLIDSKSKIINELEEKHDLRLASFRYFCNCLGQYDGSEIYLYDEDGSGIRTPEHLKDVLEKWESYYKERDNEENPYKDLKVYVLPVDVHH